MLTRDVDIMYKITRPNDPPVTHRVRWSAAELLERIDGPKRSTSIFNHRNNEVTLLNGANHTSLKLEGAARQPIETELGAQLKRDGCRFRGPSRRSSAFNPQVYATEALGLAFAFGNENGSMGFATNFGPTNLAMPNSTAGDAATGLDAPSSRPIPSGRD